jgi:Holliday junction resolvase
MPGGRASRQKGDRFERELVNLLLTAGIAATRCPVSGSAPGKFGGFDIDLPLLGRDCKVECKHHGTGFARLYKWLERVDMLIVRADRSSPLAVLPLATLIELINKK